MGKVFESLVSRLSLLTGYLSGWIIFIMMLLVAASVFSRRIFGYPLVFGDEYSAYLMVFCVFLGGAYTLREDAHIRVDVFAIRFKPRLRMLLQTVTSCLGLVYCIVLTWKTAMLVTYYKEIGHASSSVMETPTWIPLIVVPVGLGILTLQMAACIVKEFHAFLEGKVVEKKTKKGIIK